MIFSCFKNVASSFLINLMCIKHSTFIEISEFHTKILSQPLKLPSFSDLNLENCVKNQKVESFQELSSDSAFPQEWENIYWGTFHFVISTWCDCEVTYINISKWIFFNENFSHEKFDNRRKRKREMKRIYAMRHNKKEQLSNKSKTKRCANITNKWFCFEHQNLHYNVEIFNQFCSALNSIQMKSCPLWRFFTFFSHCRWKNPFCFLIHKWSFSLKTINEKREEIWDNNNKNNKE